MPGGRPKGSSPLLNAETQKAICDALELSVPEKYAAEANGIDERTFHAWMEKGVDGTEPYAAFRAAVTRARATAVVNLTKKSLEGEKGSSQATWILERRYRQEYGPVQRIEHAGDADAPVRIDGDLRIAGDIRANAKATKKIHDAIATAAGTAK